MDAVEGNDKVCGITAFLTTAYAILPQMSRSYVVFGKVITLPFTTYIFPFVAGYHILTDFALEI
ncbi:hypothetical protein AALA54_12220 [Oscillospiraceae bacterium 44-34]